MAPRLQAMLLKSFKSFSDSLKKSLKREKEFDKELATTDRVKAVSSCEPILSNATSVSSNTNSNVDW